MKRNPAALVLITPHHVNQLLFVALALLITLVAGQLYNTWQIKQTEGRLAAQIVRIHESRVSESRAQTQAAPLQTAPLMRSPALAAATTQAAAPSERWVF